LVHEIFYFFLNRGMPSQMARLISTKFQPTIKEKS